MSVRNIGKDYYAIDAEGVSISDAVHQRFERALEKIAKTPAGKFAVRLAQPEKKRSARSEVAN